MGCIAFTNDVFDSNVATAKISLQLLKELVALDRFLFSLRKAGIDVRITTESQPNAESNVLYVWMGKEMSTTDCFFSINDHILPVQVKSCWKIYKGRKHGVQDDSGYRFVVMNNTNEASYKKMIVLFLYMERGYNKHEAATFSELKHYRLKEIYAIPGDN